MTDDSGVTLNENGTMLVDLAKAEKLLAGMPVKTQLAMTNAIFEPILENATKMREALVRITEESHDVNARLIALGALPK